MKKTKFAFLVHARDDADFGHLIGNRLGIDEKLGRKLFPAWVSKYCWKIMRRFIPHVVCSRFKVSEKVEGFIVGIPITAAEMVTLPPRYVCRLIVEAALFAQNRLGCDRVGLGAYTAPLSRNGLAFLKDRRITCAVTHGDALSAASAISLIQLAAEHRRIDISKAVIAVAGGYGLVGRAAGILISELLSPAKIILTGPNANKLKRVAAEIKGFTGEIICSTDNRVIVEADIVLLCTTAAGSIVNPDMLRRNAVVIDMAQPHNMGSEVCQARPDVLRLDGGYMAVPGINPGFELGPPEGTTYACLTETIICALDNDHTHHVGPVDIDFARTIMTKAGQFGFYPAPPTSFSKPISLTAAKEISTTPAIIVKTNNNLSSHLQYVLELIHQGGPQPADYEELNDWFSALRNMVIHGPVTGHELQQMWDMAGEPFSPKTIQGLVRIQPRGYAGNFQVIDRIYQRWTAPEKHLATWDRFFHWQKATAAVRNRKDYFHSLLRELETSRPGNDLVRVLNIGSGPGRDIHEYSVHYPDSRIIFDCLDNDAEAVTFARQLCNAGESKVTFHLADALRFKTNKKYPLIWSAGLFDYFNDRTFVFMLKRLATMLAPGGELVIGNFSENNPSRGYMECGNWFLNHRNEDHLISLAQSVKNHENIQIAHEYEGVNLFLHIK